MNSFVNKALKKISKMPEEQVKFLIQSLEDESNALSAIMDSLYTGILLLDSDGKLLRSNKAAERLLSFSFSQGKKHKLVMAWDFIQYEEISAYIKESTLNKKTNVSSEFSFTVGDKVRFVTLRILPFVKKTTDEAGLCQSCVEGSVITIEDITEKRQQEILLHRMESLASLTNLAASVAHEIKNPLGAISIHIQLLQKAIKKQREGDGKLPPEKFTEHYLDIVNEEIDNLNKIVLDFLFAVRPVQATMTLCEPDSVVERMVQFFIPEFKGKGVEVRLKLCHESPRLLVDEKLLREVVTNLCQNALSAIKERFPEKGGELVVESYLKEGQYYLVVADNGSGMDEKTLSRVFEPYYTTKADGTGLGLTMVYKIIKEFQGDINVHSEKGAGTCFVITLPVPKESTLLITDASREAEK